MNQSNIVPISVNDSFVSYFSQARISLKIVNQTYNFPAALLHWQIIQLPYSGLCFSH